MVTENPPLMKVPRTESCYVNMEPTGRAESPTAEVSAADAMLKLSNSTPNLPMFDLNPNLRSALTGDFSSIGQPSVAFLSQPLKEQTRNTKQMALSPLQQQQQQQEQSPPQLEPVDVKPDLQALNGSQLSRAQRKQREFIPDHKKDDHYWVKRRKNNEAAKRSREKRRMNDLAMGEAISKVQREKDCLYRELRAIKRKFGLPLDQTFPYDDEPPCYSSPNSTADDSPNEGSHISVQYTNANTSVFPSPVVQSQSKQTPLNEVLNVPSKGFPEYSLGTITPLGNVTATTGGGGGGAKAIPFLIPVSGAPQPLALVANVAQAGFPVSPAIVASLSVPQEVHLGQNTSEDIKPDKSALNNEAPEVLSTAADTIGGGDHGENTTALLESNAAAFHSKVSGTEICRLGSPGSDSLGSLHIANQSGSASDYSECDTSDEHEGRRAPLNLCKRENEGAAQGYIEIKPIPIVSQKSSRAAIPHKLRHKLAHYLKERGSLVEEDSTGNASIFQLPLEADASNGHEPIDGSHYDSSSDGATDSPKFISSRGNTSIDPKYVERRRRNNMAARKCREQRKLATDIRVAKSSALESENERLKQELLNLTSEVSTLKELIEIKNAAKAQGKSFEPPPVLDKMSENEASNGTFEIGPSGTK